MSPGFATLTTGTIGYFPKSLDGVHLKTGLQIPVKAGYKFVFGDNFFAMGEIGFSSFTNYFDINDEVVSTTQSGFTYAPSVGFQKGKLELSIRYESTSLSGASLSAALLRLGF